MTTCFETPLEIAIPILTVLWAYVDLGLQINQSITYYQHSALNDDQTNGTGKSRHPNQTDKFYPHSVSPAYFYVIVVVWMGTLLLRPLWICLYKRAQIDSPYYSMDLIRIFYGPFVIHFMDIPCIWLYYGFSEDSCTCGCLGCVTGCLLISLYIIAALIYILVMIPAYYVYVPILQAAFISYKDPLWRTIFKCRIEVIPQSILASVYFAENYGHVLEYEDDLGIGLPVTAISCIFSLGSVVIVLITVLKAMWSKPNK